MLLLLLLLLYGAPPQLKCCFGAPQAQQQIKKERAD